MGQARRQTEEHGALVSDMLLLCAEARAVEECEHHDGMWIATCDLETEDAARTLALQRWKAGQIQAESLHHVMRALDDALGMAGDECSACAANYDA